MNSITRCLARAPAIAATVIGLLAARAEAAGPASGFIMTHYTNAVGAQPLTNADYAKAANEITLWRYAYEQYPSIASTNLCVAQVMSYQLQPARKTCDLAIKYALNEKALTPAWAARRDSRRQYVAIAYANRAVLNWLTRNNEAAAADLASARRFAPKADFVARNLAALETVGKVEPLRLSEAP